jgi:hypothetical protein
MTSREKDTDTLTRIDAAPDAPTIQNFSGDEAETHKLDPRHYAPLRVCPQCSLAWEVTGEWCPSCGTAFDKSARPTRVQPAAQAPRRTQQPQARSARRAAAHAPAQAAPPRARQKQSSGAGKVVFTVILFAAAMAVAFLVGQSTRPSASEVDRNTAQAVQTARQSAANSYRRAFDELQAKAAAALVAAQKKARAQGLAQGQANADAQAQQDSQSIFDKVTNCVISGNC